MCVTQNMRNKPKLTLAVSVVVSLFLVRSGPQLPYLNSLLEQSRTGAFLRFHYYSIPDIVQDLHRARHRAGARQNAYRGETIYGTLQVERYEALAYNMARFSL
jgi:hypothetical protein